jgi:sugar phosphate isomerase/epimerase
MFAPKIEDHLELGIVFNAMYPDVVEAERFLQTADELLHDPYFRRIEVSGIHNPDIRALFRRRLAVCRVQTSYLAQPLIFQEQLDLGSADQAVRTKAIERIRSCMAAAEDAGADMIEIISGPYPADSKVNGAIAQFAESVLLLAEQAKLHRLKLLVEMFDYDVDKKRLIGSVAHTIQLFQRIGVSEHVKLLLDLSHIPMVRTDIADTVRLLSPWIGHVHVGNTVMNPADSKFGDTHPYFGYPAGANDIDQLATFFQALHQAGYIHAERSSAVSFELICAAADRPADLIANAKRTLQLAWSRFVREGGLA